MFTGIVEDLAKISNLVKSENDFIFTVCSNLDLSDTKIGDSIAINGACLTVISLEENQFSFQISIETLDKTNFSRLNIGDYVNLERASKIGARLDGHMVSGHVDTIGSIKDIRHDSNTVFMDVIYPSSYEQYLIPKGSITIDGISLTVNDITDDTIHLALIPHTVKVTNIGRKNIGDSVHLEFDLVAKYLYRFHQLGK